MNLPMNLSYHIPLPENKTNSVIYQSNYVMFVSIGQTDGVDIYLYNSLYFKGVVPKDFLNRFINTDESQKPDNVATSVTLY